MCGSGTIAIEAALIAADRAPGLGRTFGFQKLAWYDGPAWQRIRQRAQDRVHPAPDAPKIFASESTPASSICAAATSPRPGRRLCRRGGCQRRRARRPRPTGVLIANPPYGVRLDTDAALTALYPQLGDALKQRFPGWTAYFLSGDTRLPKLIGVKPSRRTPLFNGAIECRLYRFEIVADGTSGRRTSMPDDLVHSAQRHTAGAPHSSTPDRRSPIK